MVYEKNRFKHNSLLTPKLNMRRILRLSLIIFIYSSSFIIAQTPLNIIPRPQNIIIHKENDIKLNQFLIYSEFDDKILDLFNHQFKRYIRIPFSIQKSSRPKCNIFLTKLTKDDQNRNESYSIEITPKLVLIKASTEVGIFYALQTLLHLCIQGLNNESTIHLPILYINDQPRFAWRGLMLDESRHFFGKVKVKQLLDWMAFYKLNRFHWHLTDVQGWRVEILKYPKLSIIGGIGNYHDQFAPAQFYTQEDIKEIVNYASSRFIEIIPEIDMPGHATAANKAYPEFSGGGSEKYPEFTFNPGKESTYAYLRDILKEISILFPSKYIHLGGDEVHFGNQQWNNDPYVLELMKKNNLSDLLSVERYFIKRMTDTVLDLKKNVIGWDEIVNAKLPIDNCIIMWWRHDKPEQLADALNQGYKTILCPRIPMYFDFIQDSTHQYGRRWNGDFVSLEKILSFSQLFGKTISQYPDLVIGVQANIWTETINTSDRLDYMTFPRIAAFAEIAWAQNSVIDFSEFLQRLKLSLSIYDQKGINYYNPIIPIRTPEIEGIK